jgi:sugar phosphate isomerase/epimerase
MPDIIMHVNYFETGYPLSTTFDKAKFYGYQGVELRGVRKDTATADYLKEIKTEWDRTGLKHVILSCPAKLTDDDANAREQSLAECVDLLQQAAGIGVQVFNAMAGPVFSPNGRPGHFEDSGSEVAAPEHWERATAGYKQLGPLAQSLGQTLAFEVHMGYLHDIAAGTRKLLDMIDCPAVGANLDMGNVVLHAHGEGVVDACRILGDKLLYTHLKNVFTPSAGGYIVCGLADGIIDNRVWMQTLMDMNYGGLICLEAPRQGDRDYFAKTDIDYIRSVLDDLGWK